MKRESPRRTDCCNHRNWTVSKSPHNYSLLSGGMAIMSFCCHEIKCSGIFSIHLMASLLFVLTKTTKNKKQKKRRMYLMYHKVFVVLLFHCRYSQQMYSLLPVSSVYLNTFLGTLFFFFLCDINCIAALNAVNHSILLNHYSYIRVADAFLNLQYILNKWHFPIALHDSLVVVYHRDLS